MFLSSPLIGNLIVSPPKLVEFSNISPPQSPVNQVNNRKNLQKSYNKSSNSKPANKPSSTVYTYTQASSANVLDILKLKKNFFKLSNKKIEKIHKTVNNSNIPKLCINMTTKGSSCKQIIIPMDSNNLKKFLFLSDEHVVNLDCALKGIKSDVIIDFIRSDYKGLIIVSNKVVFPSNIYVINNYIKNANSMMFKTLDSCSLNLILRH